MNTNQLYSQIVFPPSTRVFGFELRPYSAAHELMLQRMDSPLLTAKPLRELYVGELIQAALICRRDYAGLQRISAEDAQLAQKTQILGRFLLNFCAYQRVEQLRQVMAGHVRNGRQFPTSLAGLVEPAQPLPVIIGTLAFERNTPESELLNQPLRKTLVDFALLDSQRRAGRN